MSIEYRIAAPDMLDLLVSTRIEVLRAANRLDADVDMSEVAVQSRAYYRAALSDGSHTGILAFDGDRFDSDYMRIEGIIDGNLKITLKHGQNIWPEWSGDDTAEDIQNNHYQRLDDVWYNADEAKPIPADAVTT